MEKSMDEKLRTLYELSVDMAYVKGTCKVVNTDKKYDSEVSNIIWEMVDGIYSNWIMKHIEGRCSIQATLNFNMTDVENEIDRRIKLLKNAKTKEAA